jgi:hypothetical protein
MAYEVVEVGGDPEWDEEGFTMFRPKGRRHYQFEEVMNDYTPAQGDETLADALIGLLPRLSIVAAELELRPQPSCLLTYQTMTTLPDLSMGQRAAAPSS